MSARRSRHYNVAEAKARFAELVRKAMSGDEVIIARDNNPVVKLVPLEPVKTARKPGSAKGRVHMAADFEATPSDFADYA